MTKERTQLFWVEIRNSIKITPLDLFIFVLALGATVWLTLAAQSLASGSPRLRVEAAGKSFLYSLDQDQDLFFTGPLGDSHVEIKDGVVRFLDSPCRDKLCVHTGLLSSTGAWSACLPNRVVVRLEAADGTPIDDDSVADGVAW